MVSVAVGGAVSMIADDHRRDDVAGDAVDRIAGRPSVMRSQLAAAMCCCC